MENNESQEDNFKGRILKSIETKNIKVRSRAYFALRIILLIIIAVLALFISVLIFNYIFFSVRVSGEESLLNFGPRGIVRFIEFFPWAFLILDIFFIGAIEWLLRKFRFGYRSPVLYLLLGLLVITISTGYFIDRTTDLNGALLHQADHDALPGPLGELYENARHMFVPGQGMCKCTITSINGNVLTAQNIDDDNNVATFTIITPPDYAGKNLLRAGETVFVAGSVSPSGTIRAFGMSLIATSDVYYSN